MNKLIKQTVFLFILAFTSPSLFAVQTDAEVRNYSDSKITVEYRQVSVGGNVSWKSIGEVSKKRSRVFRNITIGSVIRAKSGSTVIKEFIINSPPSGSNKTVLTVK